MTYKTITEARTNLYGLIDDVCENHEPVHIQGKRGAAVLVAEEDWHAIQETLHLLSIPGLKESILRGGKISIKACKTTLNW